MAKQIKTIIKIQSEATKANPAPPIGTALGPQGINIMDFCKQFNEATKDMAGDVVPAEITIFEDRSFTFITKTSPASALLLKTAGLSKGSGVPNKDKCNPCLSPEGAVSLLRCNYRGLRAVISVYAFPAKVRRTRMETLDSQASATAGQL